MISRNLSHLGSALFFTRPISILTGHLAGLEASIGRGTGLQGPQENESGKSQERGTRIANEAAAAAAGFAVGVFAAFQTTQARSSHCEAQPPPALNPKEFTPFTLKQVEALNHNTKIYRFELQKGQRLGLPVASCLVARAPIGPPDEQGNPKPVIRPYTPITQPGVEGYFDLLVKVYPSGKMSNHIEGLKPGDTLEMKGPIPKLPCTPNMKQHIGMVAGGTGITPMLQVLDAVVDNPNDNTQVSLVFANTSPHDVLLKELLEGYAARHPNFKLFLVVDNVDPEKDDWKGGVGYMTADMLKKALPLPSTDCLILVCGPPGMMRHVSGDKAKDKSQGELEGLLKGLGYAKDQVYKF